ncbi:MAG: peptidoglycan bridge formation glycyltransferase FemA/FemB family protein [Candidatus Aenigmatarchaeota archaeon]
MAKIKLEICDNQEEWDDLVERSSHGTIFHTWKFLKIVENHTNSELYPIIGMKGTNPIGVYPLFLQKKFFLKLVFSPPPHVAIPYLGPAFVDYEQLKQSKKESNFIRFQKSVEEFLSSKLGVDYAYICSSPSIDDSRPLTWEGYNTNPRYSYSIDLSQGKDKVWKAMSKGRRNDIKRAEKESIPITKGGKKEIVEIYNLLVQRYRDQGERTNVSKDYLLDVYHSFYPENLSILFVEYDNEIITGTIDLNYKKRTYSWIGNPKPYADIPNINELLTWESIKNSIDIGSRCYEIIGIASQERLYRHYSKFNPDFSIYFAATKRNKISRIMESAYLDLIKPLKSKTF